MKAQPNYYAIIPADVRYDKDLPAGAKLMYGEITALSNNKGYCFASNGYFSKLYGCTNQAISKWIKQLEAAGYVKIEYIGEQGKVERRVSISVDRYQPELMGVSTGVEGVSTGVEHNNTSTSNTSTNKRGARFEKPTTDEIHDYMLQRANRRLADAEAEKFYDHFQSNGWKVSGRAPMKDWKASVRQWLRRAPEFSREPASPSPAPSQRPINEIYQWEEQTA